MTNGLVFYWISWLLWTLVTFFLSKGKLRIVLACIILLTIISSDSYLKIGNYTILLSFVVLLIANMLLYVKWIHKLRFLIAMFVVMIGYTALLIWKEMTPLWLFIPEEILVPAISSLLILILVRDLNKRLVLSVLAMSFGEILYSFILNSYNFNTVIGDFLFLDFLSLTFLFILLFHSIQYLHDYIYIKLSQYKHKLKMSDVI